MAGLDGRCQSLRLVAAARHPDRYGLRRSLTAVAFRRPAHWPPRRKLLACRMRSPPFPIYPVWQPPPLRVERLPRGMMDTGYHARRCFAAIRYGDGLPHGRFGKIRPSARATAVAVPYGHRRRLPQRHHGGRCGGTPKVASDLAASLFGFRRARRRFPIPSVAAAACVRAPATTPGADGGSRAAGARALRVDTRPSPHIRRQHRLPPDRARPASM